MGVISVNIDNKLLDSPWGLIDDLTYNNPVEEFELDDLLVSISLKLIEFKKIILPLSMPGVISGIVMVFMPAVSTFIISSLLGGGQYMLVGNLIEQQFTNIGDWNFGSAISIFMMIIILISNMIISYYCE